jgi:hypothetical protein
MRPLLRKFPSHNFALFATMAALASLAISGCGDGRPARVPISGQVLIDGQPLKFGVVKFVPDQGRPSSGKLDADGRFALHCFDDADGAVLGHHHVAVYANEALDDRRTHWHAPRKYANINTSGLEQQISEPKTELVIQLTWDGGKPFTEVDRGGDDDPKGTKMRAAQDSNVKVAN